MNASTRGFRTREYNGGSCGVHGGCCGRIGHVCGSEGGRGGGCPSKRRTVGKGDHPASHFFRGDCSDLLNFSQTSDAFYSPASDASRYP